jgi:hypothetical protein
MQDFLYKQNRSNSRLCPQCNSQDENTSHVLQCEAHDAIVFRQQAIHQTLPNLTKHNTSIHIIHVLEDKLTDMMKVPSLQRFHSPTTNWDIKQTMQTALKHHNIIGWDNFMCGYMNQSINRKTILEAREKARHAIIHRVKKVYRNPP